MANFSLLSHHRPGSICTLHPETETWGILSLQDNSLLEHVLRNVAYFDRWFSNQEIIYRLNPTWYFKKVYNWKSVLMTSCAVSRIHLTWFGPTRSALQEQMDHRIYNTINCMTQETSCPATSLNLSGCLWAWYFVLCPHWILTFLYCSLSHK